MKRNICKLLIFSVIVYLVSACLGEEKEIEYSDNPNFVSLKFGKNDSIPGLVGAVFTLEYDADLKDSIMSILILCRLRPASIVFFRLLVSKAPLVLIC